MKTVACWFCRDRVDVDEATGVPFRWSPEELGGAGLQDGLEVEPGEPCCPGPKVPHGGIISRRIAGSRPSPFAVGVDRPSGRPEVAAGRAIVALGGA